MYITLYYICTFYHKAKLKVKPTSAKSMIKRVENMPISKDVTTITVYQSFIWS